MSKEAEEKEM